MKTLSLVGAGAVGPAIARLLRLSGYRVATVASRRLAAAEAAVRFIGEGRATDRNPEAAEGADLLILAVPDRAIGAVAREIKDGGMVRRGSLAIHLSGALSSRVLAPLGEAGAAVGSLHPLQSFASAATAVARLRETWIFFEGSDPDRLAAVAAAISPRSAPLTPEGKALYHAGAAAASNLLVAMADLGVRLLIASGLARDTALAALLPLIDGTARNLREVGLPDALTGPVARGDAATVRAHLASMRAAAPDLVPAYVEGSRLAIRIAREKGTLTAATAEEIEQILREASPPSRG